MVKVSDMGAVGCLLTEVRPGSLNSAFSKGKLRRVLECRRASDTKSASSSNDDGDVSKIFFPDQRVSGRNQCTCTCNYGDCMKNQSMDAIDGDIAWLMKTHRSVCL